MGELPATQVNQVSKILPLYRETGNNDQIDSASSEGSAAKGIHAIQTKIENENIKKLNEKFSKPLGDVSLKFRIDEETHDVTVYIIDNATKKVVRTIPPEEVAKINAGELLQLFA